MMQRNERVARWAVPVFVVLLASLASACGDSARLPRLAKDATILAFGDSLTFGTGARESDSYPAQLDRLIGRRVIPAGIPGEVSAQARERLPSALDEHRPRLLILCIGGNDFLRRTGKREVAENVRAMVKLARDRGIDVLLVGTPEPGFTITPPEFYAEIARDLRIPYEGAVIGEVLRDSKLKSDPVHPNAEGYRIIAERLSQVLRKSGAL